MFRVLSKQFLVLPLILVVIVIPLYLSVNFRGPKPGEISSSQSEETPMATNAFGVKVEKNPAQSKLTELGVTAWPKYVALHLPFLSSLLWVCRVSNWCIFWWQQICVSNIWFSLFTKTWKMMPLDVFPEDWVMGMFGFTGEKIVCGFPGCL